MITANGKLIVLENFSIDRDLPKYRKRIKGKGVTSKEGYLDLTGDDEMGEESEDKIVGGSFNVGWRSGFTMEPVVSIITQSKEPQSFLSKLAFWKKSEYEVEHFLSVEEFFSSVKNTVQELVTVKERAEGYTRALVDAKKAGQIALIEQLSNGLNAFKMETQLIAMGLTKFVAEEDIVRFYKQSKKGLRLDHIRNFARPIPGDILEKKVHADELGLFDQYVVLHYDPQAKSFAETEKERMKRMHPDPILFGLMSGRRFLYVVGDWIDEMCTLNLDELAEHIGKGAIREINPPELY